MTPTNPLSLPPLFPPPTSDSRRFDLRGLSEEERNVRINVEMTRLAGFNPEYRGGWGNPWVYDTGEVIEFLHGTVKKLAPLPCYTTSADAVLPLLERYQWQLSRWNGERPHEPIQYWVNLPMGELNSFEGEADTFPLAACFALLRAHGFEILT